MYCVDVYFPSKYHKPLPKNISASLGYYMQLVFNNKRLLSKILDKT